MSSVPEEYEGREQSFVKHAVLKSYLERLLMIVGQRRATTIGFVDGFAGPWESRTDDLSDTSIGISIDTIAGAQQALAEMGRDVSFKALYIEKQKEPFQRLCAYIGERQASLPQGITLEAWHGEFLGFQERILDWFNRDDFVLFFIDPTGFSEIGADRLAPILERKNSEYLINFMYQFLNRFEPHARRLTGTEGPLPDDPIERERRLVRDYRVALSSAAGGGLRTAYVRVKNRREDRPLFHLVYGTRHHKGIVVFMTESERAEQLVQPAARAAVATRRTGQTILFTEATVRTPRTPTTDLRDEWLHRLDTEAQAFDERDLAEMLEETDCFPGDIQEALKALIEQGRVENLDAKKQRRSRFVNFEKSERLKLIEEID